MVFGLKGPKRENEHETLRVVTEFARNYLGVAPERWQIRMAHRLNINAENAGIIVVFNCGYMRDAWVQGSIDNAPALKQHKMSVVTDLPPVLRTVRSQLLDLRRQKLYTTKEWAKARVKQLAQWPFLQLVVQEAAPDGTARRTTIVDHTRTEEQLAASYINVPDIEAEDVLSSLSDVTAQLVAAGRGAAQAVSDAARAVASLPATFQRPAAPHTAASTSSAQASIAHAAVSPPILSSSVTLTTPSALTALHASSGRPPVPPPASIEEETALMRANSATAASFDEAAARGGGAQRGGRASSSQRSRRSAARSGEKGTTGDTVPPAEGQHELPAPQVPAYAVSSDDDTLEDDDGDEDATKFEEAASSPSPPD